MKFYNDEHRLVACDDDACAIWQGDKWVMGTVELARELWISGTPMSRPEAAQTFPDADLDALPDMTARKAEIAAGYDQSVDAAQIIAEMGEG